jgi:hypothetical protein
MNDDFFATNLSKVAAAAGLALLQLFFHQSQF